MRSRTALAWVAVALNALFLSVSSGAAETHADAIIQHILETRQAILRQNAGAPPDHFAFLAFWDFDGTLLKGDCSEGLVEDGSTVYAGLAQLAIESGFSPIYPPTGGFERFWKDYQHMEEDVGKWLAYPFIPQMLRGADAAQLRRLSQDHFNRVLKDYYFSSSIRMLNALEQNGIECHVLTASADVFVKGAASSLRLPAERIHGIEVRVRQGRLTEELIYPVTLADGKTEKLESIVQDASRAHPGAEVVVLAAFGNSYGSDGPFMHYVTGQRLPAGSPIAVMINGGEEPAADRGLFTRVEQTETVAAPSTR